MFFAESQGSVPLKQGSSNAGLHRTERVLYFPQMFEKGKVEGNDEAAKLQLLRPNWKESLTFPCLFDKFNISVQDRITPNTSLGLVPTLFAVILT